MSAEPGRKAPYSKDIAWRVVWQRIAMELPFRKIAKNLNLSLGTVHNMYKRFEQTGDVQRNKPLRREYLRALNGQQELLLISLILENPSLYLSEMCKAVHEMTGLEVSASTLCRVIHRHGLTRKKIQQVAKQRSDVYRGRFMAEIQLYSREQFVWIDETGCAAKDHIRRFGYALLGECPVYHRLLHKGKRISATAGICTTGLLALELKKGTNNGDAFYDFVRGSLIPNMLPFNGQNPRSIAILDNCSIHHVQAVLDLFRDSGILVLFLPPYSPDYNPIEEAFSYIKYYLKEHDELLQAINDPIPIIQAAFDSITSEQCNGWINHSGYPD